MRAALTRLCAATCLLFGGLQLLCNAFDFAAGGSVIQLALGVIWALACIVCGLKVMNAPAKPAKTEEV